MRIEIWRDSDTENPCEYGGWKIYSFSTRHNNYCHPDKFFTSPDKWRIEYLRKANAGLAFPLSYYEHGLCQWSLQGDGPQCQWDTVYFAGVAVWESSPSDIGAKTKEGRAKDLASLLRDYTDWCNGECYGFTVYDENGEDIDSCGGFIGSDHLIEHLKEYYPDCELQQV